ncbi:hypothetical protein S1OALGB6SA_684 [Olavius algarvensis spirochete endosymbiont]|nr:hypothetical protein S1OALGB6SA_684 [Olavius algarvensis spirochete endosymbiont]
MSLENRRIVSQADFLKNRTSSIPIAGAGNLVHENHNASHFTWNSIFFANYPVLCLTLLLTQNIMAI